jgi:hypothetical protein
MQNSKTKHYVISTSLGLGKVLIYKSLNSHMAWTVSVAIFDRNQKNIKTLTMAGFSSLLKANKAYLDNFDYLANAVDFALVNSVFDAVHKERA